MVRGSLLLLAVSLLAACKVKSPGADLRPADLSRERPASDGAGEGGPREAGGDGRLEAGSPCAPLHLSFPLGAAVPLACDASAPRVVLQVQLPAAGRALARANLQVRHVGAPLSTVIHFWSARVEVGSPVLAYAVGDDVCPGVTSQRTNLGLGTVAAGGVVRVLAHQGASPCIEGALQVEAGSSLEVWLESTAAACSGRMLRARSYYQTAGVTQLWEWPTSTTAILGESLQTEGAAEKLRVLAVIEGTPQLNPNPSCGAEAATLVAQTLLDGAVLATVTDVVPASQGMGHLVLSLDAVKTVAAGVHKAELLAGKNFLGQVTTGGCCGDAVLALVREP